MPVGTSGRHDQSQLLMPPPPIYLKSVYLSPDQGRAAHLSSAEDIQATIEEAADRHGRADASVYVLPQGL